VHHFFDDSGHLAVELSILDSSGTSVADWTIFATQTDSGHCVAPACTLYVSPVPIAEAGGHRYGWFVNQEFPILAIDNVSLASISEPGDKNDCKNGGWDTLFRADGSSFKNQGDCIQYVNTGK
jgi:hypothetical protein